MTPATHTNWSESPKTHPRQSRIASSSVSLRSSTQTSVTTEDVPVAIKVAPANRSRSDHRSRAGEILCIAIEVQTTRSVIGVPSEKISATGSGLPADRLLAELDRKAVMTAQTGPRKSAIRREMVSGG